MEFKVGDKVRALKAVDCPSIIEEIDQSALPDGLAYKVVLPSGKYDWMWKDDFCLWEDTSPMFKFDVPEQALFDVYSYGASETDIQHVSVKLAFSNKEGSAILDALHSSLGIGGIGLHTIRFDSAVNVKFKGNSQQQLYPQIMEQLKANVAKINGSITIHPVAVR